MRWEGGVPHPLGVLNRRANKRRTQGATRRNWRSTCIAGDHSFRLFDVEQRRHEAMRQLHWSQSVSLSRSTCCRSGCSRCVRDDGSERADASSRYDHQGERLSGTGERRRDSAGDDFGSAAGRGAHRGYEFRGPVTDLPASRWDRQHQRFWFSLPKPWREIQRDGAVDRRSKRQQPDLICKLVRCGNWCVVHRLGTGSLQLLERDSGCSLRKRRARKTADDCTDFGTPRASRPVMRPRRTDCSPPTCLRVHCNA